MRTLVSKTLSSMARSTGAPRAMARWAVVFAALTATSAAAFQEEPAAAVQEETAALQEETDKPRPTSEAPGIAVPVEDAVTVPFFGNETCPFMGKPIRGDKFVEKDGKKVYVCCAKCMRRAEADFDQAYAAAYPADKVKELNNELCPIMGGETEHSTSTTEFQGHEVRFCCAGCDRKFHKQPNRHLALLTSDSEGSEPLRVLGNKKCLVEPEADIALDTFFIYKGVLIDASSAKAIETFKKSPDLFLKAAGVDIATVGA